MIACSSPATSRIQIGRRPTRSNPNGRSGSSSACRRNEAGRATARGCHSNTGREAEPGTTQVPDHRHDCARPAATRRLPPGSVSGQTRSRCPAGGSHQRLPTLVEWCGSPMVCGSPVTAAWCGSRGDCPARSSTAHHAVPSGRSERCEGEQEAAVWSSVSTRTSCRSRSRSSSRARVSVGQGRWATDKAGFAALMRYVRQIESSREDRFWAVEGANGAGRSAGPAAARCRRAGGRCAGQARRPGRGC